MVFESLRTSTKRPEKPYTLILAEVELTMTGNGNIGTVIDLATLLALPPKTKTPLRNTTLLALSRKTENRLRTMTFFFNDTTTFTTSMTSNYIAYLSPVLTGQQLSKQSNFRASQLFQDILNHHNDSTITISHSILLLRSLKRRNPPRSLRSKQLHIRLTALQSLSTKHTSLDNLHTREILSISVQSRSTFATEVGSDFLARVCSFGVGFGGAGYGEAFLRDDVVDAESAAADLLAVGAVA
jgi:hypothetical protein